jgi:4-amino-4-deoxy-L-arabinose transferase-like glycosyltransferase
MSTGTQARVAVGPRGLAVPALLARVPTWAALAGICALAAALRFADFGAVPTTPFYDAAVRSMGLSWHNFFYGVLDPSGRLAIDKPPVDLWLQVASTKLFGFSSDALRLPPALAGALTVPLLYDLVRRGFGRAAGLAAALALAVLPATVLTSRSDTMDAVMALLLVFAAWLVVRAAPEKRARAVVLAGAVAGLAFEVKLTEAMVALPALGVLAWLALDEPGPRKRRVLALAGAAYVAVAASWAVVASLLPGQHPYAYGSSDGSIWNMILVYNGVSRLGNPPTSATTPGLLRLFDPSAPRHFGQLLGAELLCALVVGGLAVALARRGGPVTGDAARLRRALGWCLGVWLVLGFMVASFMGRQWPRYLEAFTPAVAAVLGVGVVLLAQASVARRRGLAALGVCAAVAAVAGLPTGGGGAATAVAATLAGAALLALAASAARPARHRALAGTGAALVLAAALAVPFATAVHVVRTGQGDGEDTGAMAPAQLASLSAYLRAHQGGARYEAAGARVFNNVALVTRDARPMLTLSNVGDRPLMSPAQLASAARSGQVRYALIGHPSCLRKGIETCSPAVRWARAHGTDVSHAAGLAQLGVVYRLPGRH